MNRLPASPRPVPPHRIAAALLLAACCAAAHAQDEAPLADELEQERAASDARMDADVYATLMPSTNVVPSAVVDAAIASVLAAKVDPRRQPVVPASPPRVPTGPRPIQVGGNPVIESPATLQVAGELVMVRADGMPGPNAPSADPFVRVLPRAVNPADVQVGAHWGAQQRLDVPIVKDVALIANADVFAGPTPHPAVRRSLRITAQWDTPEDLTIGLTPGVEHVAGSLLEHHVTGLQASTVDARQAARWRSFIEVSGEKLGPSNFIDNATAQVHAGASYSASNTTQFDVSVSRGTTALSDFQSAVGLQVHF